MPETIDDVQPNRSWMPIAMTAAFVVGAGATGWIVFHEEIKEWFRIEDLAWEPVASERLAIEQRDRLRRVVSGEADHIVVTDTEWQIIPATSARVPGEVLSWRQTLYAGYYEIRDGDVVHVSKTLAAPDPMAPPAAAAEVDPVVPGPVALLDSVLGLDLDVGLDALGSVATSTSLPEVLEQIETRRSGKVLDRRKPLDATQLELIHADVGVLAQRVAFDLAACVPSDYYRPGQTWTREVTLPISEWGMHAVRLEMAHEGYDGDVALISGTIARKPTEGALTSEDGLSGLKGEIHCRFDIKARRVTSGQYTLEARGKSNHKFATLGIDHAFGVSGSGEVPTIPADMDLPALPAASAPTEPTP